MEALYGREGGVVAWLDEETIYGLGGEALGFLRDEDVFSYRGRHLGVLVDGWIWDHSGFGVAFSEEAASGPVSPSGTFDRCGPPVMFVRVQPVMPVPPVRALRHPTWPSRSFAEWMAGR